ncbi:HypA protein [Xylaria curta]|nr:HypA protein [Xylaria curta]
MITTSRLLSLTKSNLTTNYSLSRHLSKMATARTIKITPENTGLWHQKQSEAAAKKTTELLQQDLEKHHCFFNNMGFHNHISHFLLSLYGLGASAEQIQQGYDDNANYQRAMYQVHPEQIEALKDFDKAKEKLGKEEFYTDFLAFYQSEIDKKGWKEVLNEYLFKGDERSDDLLARMFAGYIHPIIQLMYGIEWEQPAIVAMGLAQASVHEDNLRKYFLTAEKVAGKSSDKMPEIASLFKEVSADEKTPSVPDERIRQGPTGRVFDEALRVAAKVKVAPQDLEARTVEMFNTAVFQGACAAIRPGKEARFDFWLMHQINLCPIFLTINAQDWISTANKVRLLEWKIRFDIIEYTARAWVPVSIEKIASYVPKENTRKPAAELLPRIKALRDDGHVSKLSRAVGLCEHASKKYENQDWLKIKGEDLWNKVHQLVIDSAEGKGPKWVQGFAGNASAEAWNEVPDRK